MAKIAASTMKRMMKEFGAERVSDDAALSMAKYLTDIAEDTTKKLVILADKAGRNTVRESDFDTLFEISE